MTLKYVHAIQVYSAKSCNRQCSYCYVNTTWMDREKMADSSKLEFIFNWYIEHSKVDEPYVFSFGGLEPSLEVSSINYVLDRFKNLEASKKKPYKIYFSH